MPQTRYFVRTSRVEANRLFAALETAFEEDGAPLAVTEIDEAKDIHEISLYAEEDGDAEVRFAGVLTDLGHPAEFGTEVLPDVDWVTRSLEGLKPVRAGRFLVHGSHDRYRRRIGDLAIEIEAGLAFGTGHHGATAGCLEMIAKVARRERFARQGARGTGLFAKRRAGAKAGY